MPTYCTVDDVKVQMQASQVASMAATETVKILALCRSVTAQVDRLFQARRPFFFPYIESRQKSVTPHTVNTMQNSLFFVDNLLELTSVTAGTTALTIGSTVEAWPTSDTPYHYLRLMSYWNNWYQYLQDDSIPLFVTINGVWGFHRDYANAWLKVDDLAGDINASVTSLSVADVDGTDDYGRTPRISAGNLLKIGTEYLEVTATNTGTNAVTVRRGVNGSTAAAHTAGDDVYVWQVEDTIRAETARQVGYVYARRGAYETATINDIGVQQFPPTMVASLLGAVEGYSYGLP